MIYTKIKHGTKSLQYHTTSKKWFFDQIRSKTNLGFKILENTGLNFVVIDTTMSGLLEFFDDDWIVVYPDGSAEVYGEYEYTLKFDSA